MCESLSPLPTLLSLLPLYTPPHPSLFPSLLADTGRRPGCHCPAATACHSLSHDQASCAVATPPSAEGVGHPPARGSGELVHPLVRPYQGRGGPRGRGQGGPSQRAAAARVATTRVLGSPPGPCSSQGFTTQSLSCSQGFITQFPAAAARSRKCAVASVKACLRPGRTQEESKG